MSVRKRIVKEKQRKFMLNELIFLLKNDGKLKELLLIL